VEERVDDPAGRESVLLGETNGVDPHDRIIRRGADEGAERAEQLAVAGERGGERGELPGQ
jgi:hypothetical protein